MIIWRIYGREHSNVKQRTERTPVAGKWVSALLLFLFAAVLLTVSYTHGRLFFKELGISLTLILLLIGHRVLENR